MVGHSESLESLELPLSPWRVEPWLPRWPRWLEPRPLVQSQSHKESQGRRAGGRIHTSCEVTNRWKKRDIQILRSIEEHSVTHSYKRLQEATRGYKLIKQYWSWVFLVPVSVFQMWLESLSLQKTETTVENAVARKSLGFIRREWCIRRWRPSPNHPYPLVNIQKTMERSTMLLMGKSM